MSQNDIMNNIIYYIQLLTFTKNTFIFLIIKVMLQKLILQL